MTTGFSTHLAQSFEVTAPILLILALGIWFRKQNWVGPDFVSVGNWLVYNVTLPSLLFLSTATRPLSASLPVSLVIFAAICTVVTVFLIWLLAPLLVESGKRGVFTQNAFRSNMGIIGLALCLNAFGAGVLPKAGFYLAIMVVLYNVLAVLVLSPSRNKLLPYMLKNPLLIGIVAGLIWRQFNLPLPGVVLKSGEYFAQMTLPLALLCVGASLNWHSIRSNHKEVIYAVCLKMLIIPSVLTFAAAAYGFRGEELGIFFLMMAAPTASAAFVMAKAMTPYGSQAAESIALGTIIAPITITFGLALLSALQLL